MSVERPAAQVSSKSLLMFGICWVRQRPTRGLLVSHWPVASDAAVQITTRMLQEAQKPGVGRAEAHRRAMLAMINNTAKPHFAHPLFWAPFVVVGDGG